MASFIFCFTQEHPFRNTKRIIELQKKLIFPLVAAWLLMPAIAFAINPFYVDKGETIGQIFLDVIFGNLFGFLIIGL